MMMMMISLEWLLVESWDHTVLPATWHKWMHPTLTPARSWYSIYLPWGMEGWVDL